MDQPKPNICSVEPVLLNVGGREFRTTVGTLTANSGFFAAYFSGRWTVPKLADGSVFVDADSDLFEHILRYLRHGIFPIAYDELHYRHDVNLYQRLTALAGYFDIPKLNTWLAESLWVKSVNVTHRLIPFRANALALGDEVEWTNRGLDLRKIQSTWANYDRVIEYDAGWSTDHGEGFFKYWEEKAEKNLAIEEGQQEIEQSEDDQDSGDDDEEEVDGDENDGDENDGDENDGDENDGDDGDEGDGDGDDAGEDDEDDEGEDNGNDE